MAKRSCISLYLHYNMIVDEIGKQFQFASIYTTLHSPTLKRPILYSGRASRCEEPFILQTVTKCPFEERPPCPIGHSSEGGELFPSSGGVGVVIHFDGAGVVNPKKDFSSHFSHFN